jgi:hypothetical protein
LRLRRAAGQSRHGQQGTKAGYRPDETPSAVDI